MGRLRTCDCETCPKCKHRAYMHEYLRRDDHAERARERVRRWRAENIQAVREKDRSRGYRPAPLEVRRARRKVRDLPPQPCEVCGATAQKHHADYAKPLEIQWLCRKHHGQLHQRVNPVRTF